MDGVIAEAVKTWGRVWAWITCQAPAILADITRLNITGCDRINNKNKDVVDVVVEMDSSGTGNFCLLSGCCRHTVKQCSKPVDRAFCDLLLFP